MRKASFESERVSDSGHAPGRVDSNSSEAQPASLDLEDESVTMDHSTITTFTPRSIDPETSIAGASTGTTRSVEAEADLSLLPLGPNGSPYLTDELAAPDQLFSMHTWQETLHMETLIQVPEPLHATAETVVEQLNDGPMLKDDLRHFIADWVAESSKEAGPANQVPFELEAPYSGSGFKQAVPLPIAGDFGDKEYGLSTGATEPFPLLQQYQFPDMWTQEAQLSNFMGKVVESMARQLAVLCFYTRITLYHGRSINSDLGSQTHPRGDNMSLTPSASNTRA